MGINGIWESMAMDKASVMKKSKEPTKFTGFASLYEEAAIAPSKDKSVFYWPQSDDEVKRVPMHPSNISNFVESKEFPDVYIEKDKK